MFNKQSLFPKSSESPHLRSRKPISAGGAATAQDEAAPAPNRLDTWLTKKEGNPESRIGAANGEKQPTDVAQTSDSRLIVGPSVKLKGAEILDCDTLIVEGHVEATMDSRVLRIDATGSFVGTVSIDVAEIRGRFEGELTVRDQLIIHASGCVGGKVRYGKLFIEEGGEISGDIQTISKHNVVIGHSDRFTSENAPDSKVSAG